jgi:hypothetical protein
LFAKRLKSLLDAVEQMIRTQQLNNAKPRHCILSTYGLEASYGKIDAISVTPANEVTQDLRSGKVDLDNTRRL